jgi:hypothetical protein
MMRAMKGPATVGNVFGYYGVALPPGRWALVEDCKYCNGGSGPALWADLTFPTRDEAERYINDRGRREEHDCKTL